MGSHNGSNGNPLEPPLFWLDNTFNMMFFLSLTAKIGRNGFKKRKTCFINVQCSGPSSKLSGALLYWKQLILLVSTV